jgi:hypothetical protein
MTTPTYERTAYIDPWLIAYYNLLIKYSKLQDKTIMFGNIAFKNGIELIEAKQEIARLKT